MISMFAKANYTFDSRYLLKLLFAVMVHRVLEKEIKWVSSLLSAQVGTYMKRPL